MRDRLSFYAAFALIIITLGACTKPPVIPAGSPTPSSTQPGETQAEGGSASPVPPTLSLTPEEPFSGEGPWPVTFTTPDNVTIHGTLYGQGTKAVILAPMYLSGQEAWKSFAETLGAQNYRVLTFDFRGYGESEGERNPATAADDLGAAVAFMKQNEFQPVTLIGAGLGGSAAVRVASQDPTIDGAAIISAPKSFQGFELSDGEVSALSTPSLWLAARNDMTQNVEDLFNAAASTDKSLWIYEGSSLQGTFIFEGADGSDMQKRLLDFVAHVAGL